MLVDIINEQAHKNEVFLIILNDEIEINLLNQITNNIKVITIGRQKKSYNLLPFFRLNWYLFKTHPDIIHCHHFSAACLIINKKKLFLTVHTIDSNIKNYKAYKRVFAISETVRTNLEQRYNIKPVVAFNGINSKIIKVKTDYDFNQFKIVQVSRLEHERKGQHVLIKAMNILVNEIGISNIYLDFIGDGQSRNHLIDLVESYHLQHHIKFLGLQDRAYIYEHLNYYDLLIQPSLIEGFGLTIAEGMSAKIPVLVSDINAALEIIQNGRYGWVFSSGNEESCSQKVIQIINEYGSSEFKDKIQKAHQFASETFSISNTALSYLKEYESFLSI